MLLWEEVITFRTVVNKKLSNLCIWTITGIWSLILLLGVKIIHLVDRTNLFKISNLVWSGKEIVTSLYSSLDGQMQTVYGWYSELAVSPFVIVKMNGLEKGWEQLTLLISTAFGHLKS